MRKNSIIKSNILQFLDLKGITKYEFYKKTGVSNGVLSQDSGMSEENTARFLSYYDYVNPAWLVTGIGEMFLNNEETTVKETENVVNEPIAEYGNKGIPLVSSRAVGGFGSCNFSIENKDIKDYYVIPKFKHKKIDFMIEVEGSSMYPKYNSGDIVACRIINESKFIQWNKTHVVSTHDQGILIKRIKQGESDRHLKMISDNTSYDPFEVNMEDISGIALVVGVIRLE